MGTEKLKDFQEDFALFIEAGFTAVKQLDETNAKRLFEAAQILRPESTTPQIGLGYIALNKLDIVEASSTFEKIIECEPKNHLARAFLGISYLLTKAKRKRGEELIAEASEEGDSSVKNLCSISLKWAEKDLKKRENRPPFFLSSPEEEKSKT